MTLEELDTIVRKHEMQRLELKESFSTECIETACAFTNAQGGFIVIGVDNDGNPSKNQLRFEGLRDYENKISTATEPCVAVDAEKVEFRGREVVVLRVIENPLKPVAYKGRPRPELHFFVEQFKETVPYYMVKHQVKPGMTGWAQINGYRGDTSIEKRIELDLWYIENWSPWLDIRIILKTVFGGVVNSEKVMSR